MKRLYIIRLAIAVGLIVLSIFVEQTFGEYLSLENIKSIVATYQTDNAPESEVLAVAEPTMEQMPPAKETVDCSSMAGYAMAYENAMDGMFAPYRTNGRLTKPITAADMDTIDSQPARLWLQWIGACSGIEGLADVALIEPMPCYDERTHIAAAEALLDGKYAPFTVDASSIVRPITYEQVKESGIFMALWSNHICTQVWVQ